MRRGFIVFLAAGVAAVHLQGAPLLPTATGTIWNYDLTQETSSEGLDLTAPTKKDHFVLTYRIGGTQRIDDKDFTKLQLYRGDTLVSTDLITVDEHGIVCGGRLDDHGTLAKFDPPQILLPTPLKAGGSWTFTGNVGDKKVDQRYEIGVEEDVQLAAGKYRAWRIHCEQTLPSKATIDRWFVPGTGFVKVVTKIKGTYRGAIQQTSLELKQPPRVPASPMVEVHTTAPKLTAGLSKDPQGEFVTTIKSDTATIYARWRSGDLPAHANIRAVWIAEHVPDVPEEYEIDESSAVAEDADASGAFTLMRPDDGWALGDYRVEFYVNDTLAQTVKLKISK